jgi:hypothetical protein
VNETPHATNIWNGTDLNQEPYLLGPDADSSAGTTNVSTIFGADRERKRVAKQSTWGHEDLEGVWKSFGRKCVIVVKCRQMEQDFSKRTIPLAITAHSRVKLCRVAITIDYHAIAMSATGLDVRKGSPIAPTVKHVLTKNLIASVVLLW